MSKTITINNIEFRNDCIGFRGLQGAYWIRVPTSECFVHVWQKSSDFNNFKENLQVLWQEYVAQDPVMAKFSFSFNENSMRVRASTYRSKGVNLKYFPRKDWKSLAKLAKASLCRC